MTEEKLEAMRIFRHIFPKKIALFFVIFQKSIAFIK